MVRRTTRKPSQNKAADVTDVGLVEYSRMAMSVYGSYVLENRAIPDFRDGLKPVQRRILWSMHKMGLASSKGDRGLKKAARVVGDVLGRYHPHGDTSVYDAMVNMVSSVPQPVVHGDGNWGDCMSDAAAMRYVEARLSSYSDAVFFNSDYLPVTELVPNFDGSEKEPLLLPSLLPNILVNGASGIAVGGTTSIPSFKIPGLVKLVKKALSGKKITVNDCVKNLEFNYRNGGANYIDEGGADSYLEYLVDFYKTGIGSVWFYSPYTWDRKTRTLTFNSFAPNLDIAKAVSNVTDLDYVLKVSDETSLEEGICFAVHIKKSNEYSDAELQEEVASYFETKMSYRVNVTERYYDTELNEARAKFYALSIPDLLHKWCEWRTQVEVQALNHHLDVLGSDLSRQQLLLLAINNRRIILDSLEQTDSVAYLVKHLKITVEQANAILDMRIRTLQKLNATDVEARIKELQARARTAKTHLKAPAAKIAAEIDSVFSVDV